MLARLRSSFTVALEVNAHLLRVQLTGGRPRD